MGVLTGIISPVAAPIARRRDTKSHDFGEPSPSDIRSTPLPSSRASSPVQVSGRNSRRPTIIGTSPRASVSDSKVWQFEVLPKADAYCGATPTECVPL